MVSIAGKRRFHVRIEGQEVMRDHEPVPMGLRTASKKSFDLSVNDGLLEIDFVHTIQNPKISALEIARLDSGRTAFISSCFSTDYGSQGDRGKIPENPVLAAPAFFPMINGRPPSSRGGASFQG